MRRIFTLLLVFILFWIIALLHFLQEVPKHPLGDAVSTDAIVVLTGGSKRVEYGLESLARRDAKKLFISGVGEGVTVADLMVANHAADDIKSYQKQQRIVLGYNAKDTRGNALETAEWMVREHYRSARVVTANYHLPRAMVEFKRAMPEVVLVADPVFPDEFKRDRWWDDPRSLTIVMAEFHKYLAAWLQLIVVDALA